MSRKPSLIWTALSELQLERLFWKVSTKHGDPLDSSCLANMLDYSAKKMHTEGQPMLHPDLSQSKFLWTACYSVLKLVAILSSVLMHILKTESSCCPLHLFQHSFLIPLWCFEEMTLGAIAGMFADRHVLGAGLHDHDALQCGDSVYSGHWSWKHHRWGCRRRLAKNQGPHKNIMWIMWRCMYTLCILSAEIMRYVVFWYTSGKTQSCCLYTIPLVPSHKWEVIHEAYWVDGACKLSVALRTNIEKVTFLDSPSSARPMQQEMFSSVSTSMFTLFGTVSSWSLMKFVPLFEESLGIESQCLLWPVHAKKAPVFGDDGFELIGNDWNMTIYKSYSSIYDKPAYCIYIYI